MKHRSQKLMAVVMVTAALCADRAVVAAPSVRPVEGTFASRFVDRLTRNLGRVVQSVKLHQHRLPDQASMVLILAPSTQAPTLHPHLTPQQLRLPPPLA